MSELYTIRIGAAVLRVAFPKSEWEVRPTTAPGCPESEDAVGNERRPSVDGWEAFVRDADLEDEFFSLEGLMITAGCHELTQRHVDRFFEARARWVDAHPQARARYCHCRRCDPERGEPGQPHDPTASGVLVRLDWLCWWSRWALETCQKPAFWNG